MPDRAALIDAFLDANGWGAAARTALAGDASNRRYLRLARPDGTRAVLMDAPPARGEDVRPFTAIARHLRGLDLSAPAILAEEDGTGLLLLEDLGDALFARVLSHDPAMEPALYRAATDLLIALHRSAPPEGLATYDPALMADLATLALDWYRRGTTGAADAALRGRFQAVMEMHLRALPELDAVLIQRDYHAENLLWLPDRKGVARVGLLDFQDAMRGHRAYDLVSLLQDARRDVAPETARAMRAHYINTAGADAERFTTAFHWLGAQRNLRILGVFARLSLRDGKPHYVDLIPRVWAHLQTDLRHPALAPLANLVARCCPRPRPRILPGSNRAARRDVPVMIFAAGFGTRMGALTKGRPKPLIEVAGRALIDHALGLVAEYAPPRTVVNLHYRADQLAAHLAGRDVILSHETPKSSIPAAVCARRCRCWARAGDHDEFRRHMARPQPADTPRAPLGRDPHGRAALVPAARARPRPWRAGRFHAGPRWPPRPRGGARLFRRADHRSGLARGYPRDGLLAQPRLGQACRRGAAFRRGLSRPLVRCGPPGRHRDRGGDAGAGPCSRLILPPASSASRRGWISPAR